ncbi:MAG: hypothetical protein RMJ67_01065 [Elusimicrobiota bacterium]|nr:hypothetical protein [Endomicrobiia bacterium]MDW8165093.1 hypothetical protein [Elusimicrobiota bacterium]
MLEISEFYNSKKVYFELELAKRKSEIQHVIEKIPFLSKFKRNIELANGEIDIMTFYNIYFVFYDNLYNKKKVYSFFVKSSSEKEYLETIKVMREIRQLIFLKIEFDIGRVFTRFSLRPLIGNAIVLSGRRKTIEELSEYFEKRTTCVF